MKKILLSIFPLLASFVAFGQSADSMIGRSFKSFDDTAFCSYTGFHPSSYMTDNNWDILCAFIKPGKTERLDSLGIKFNKSQLRLLEVGDLLSAHNGVYTTTMPIFGKYETQLARQQSKEFSDSVFPIIEPKIRQLLSLLDKAGYSRQKYSIVFSYLLDTYIWDDDKLPSPQGCGNHGTWSGAYWAMFNPRAQKIGTNSFGTVSHNWTDALGYWPSDSKMISFAKEVMKIKGSRIEDKDVIAAVDGWGLTDKEGNILIPVMHPKNNDEFDSLCNEITTELSSAVKNYCRFWGKENNISSEKIAQVIFYHEVMWDLLDIMESKGLITMPSILKGEKVGKEHFGDISFIVVEEAEE